MGGAVGLIDTPPLPMMMMINIRPRPAWLCRMWPGRHWPPGGTC